MAINREQIVRDVSRGYQVAASHFSPPGIAGFIAQARRDHCHSAAENGGVRRY
jgi:ABC-type oligopeptide transport system substrate-binding subunit